MLNSKVLRSLGVAVFIGLCSCGRDAASPPTSSTSTTDASAQAAVADAEAAASAAEAAASAAGFETAAPPAVRQFTPKEFEAYASQRTKAQIRAEFGKPDGISAVYPDTWTYSIFNPTLVVTDPDAGVRMTVNVQFSGAADAAQDAVISVRY
jgi:hypothetical protein